MPVVIGCVVPHPPIIVPEIGRESINRVTTTVQAMKDMASDIAAASPETLVFISPHSTGFADNIAVKADARLKGSFESFGAPAISFSAPNDLAFIEELIKAANSYDVPITKIGQAYMDLMGSDQLDHGVLVPLYYTRQELDVPVVSISVTYGGFDEHYMLGMAIQKASNAIPQRIALIASGDLSHRLIPGAPAGYSARAIDFDAKIEEIFDTGYFDELKDLDPSLIEAAGECGLRSIYALAGAFNNLDVRTHVLSYEGPFGVGYMVAAVYPGEYAPERDIFTVEIEKLPPVEPEPSAPVRLALYSLEHYYKEGHPVDPPEDTPAELLNRQAGAFVCLKIDGDLRGCVGTVQPTQDNLAAEIMANAIQAATEDPRFYPVAAEELPRISFTVDILDAPERVQSKTQLDPEVYGIIVRHGYKTGLLLPDIEGVTTSEQQIAIAKQKAGIAPAEEVELFRFRVIRYE